MCFIDCSVLECHICLSVIWWEGVSLGDIGEQDFHEGARDQRNKNDMETDGNDGWDLPLFTFS